MPHHYEHLKKSFFKNLRYIDFEGHPCSWVNVRDAVCLLEGDMKNREFLALRLGDLLINYKEELKSLLKKIFKVKKKQNWFEDSTWFKVYDGTWGR